MNLLLVAPHEVDAAGTCSVADDRAVHLRTILKVIPGSTVRAGVAGGGLGTAQVLADDGVAITLALVLGPAPPAVPIQLVLAIPRPKVITRVVEIAASFAIARLELTNAWRVEKSYLDSPRLAPDALAAAACRGAAQGATTHLPAITVHRRLMSLLGDGVQIDKLGHSPDKPDGVNAGTWLDKTDGSADAKAMKTSTWAVRPVSELVNLDTVPKYIVPKYIAHPDAPPIERAFAPGPCVFAIGPEGGWIERELETFVARGFRPVSLGAPILRVEAAVAAALAQLMLLERIARRG